MRIWEVAGHARITVIAAAYLAISILFTWPLARYPAAATTDPFGDPLLNAWILAWDADSALHAFQGYWNGLFFYPYRDTVAYSEHLLGIAAFTAPVQWATGNPVLSLNLALIGAGALAGFGAWLLARDVCGRDDVAFVAGLAVACSPIRVPHITHLQVLMSGWIPVSLWALERYLRTRERKWLIGWAVAFLLNAGSNGYYLFFVLPPTLFVLARGLWRDRTGARRTVLEMAAACVPVLALLAPIAAAYLRVRREQGLWRTLSTVLRHSADLDWYLQASRGLWLWGRVLPAGSTESALFPGLTVTALAVVAVTAVILRANAGLADRRWRSDAWLYLAVTTGALVLSLGPEPTAFGWRMPFTGPYGWLLGVVPGLNGLRVPARMATIVSLGLAMLAAIGLERLTRRLAGRPRFAVIAACGLAIMAEGYSGPLRVERVPSAGMAADRAAYAWLRDQASGPMLELPVGDTATRVRYVASTLVHRHRIVNGYSGYGSALQGFVGFPFADLARLDDALAMARALGIRWIGVHPPLFGARPATGGELVRALRGASDHVLRVEDFGSMALAELRPGALTPAAADPAWPEVPVAAFRATASANDGALALAFDRDPDTRWSSGARQRGQEWIELAFDPPRDIARVRLEANRRTVPDYPRGLVITSSSDGVRFSPLFEGGVADRLALSIVREAARPGIDIALPPNATRVLRLSTTGETGGLYWSVTELRVFERR